MDPFYQEPMATVYCGDALEVLKTLPDECAQMAMSSPPYWGLRNYAGGTDIIWSNSNDCEHEWDGLVKHRSAGGPQVPQTKWPSNVSVVEAQRDTESGFCSLCGAWRGQLGLEPTPELYVDHLMMIFQEVKRLVKKDGAFYLNIGDTYVTGKGSCINPGGGPKSWSSRVNSQKNYPIGRDAPNRMYKGIPPKCMACIPERVLFAMLEDGWILRNKIIWHKPNGLPSSAKDRFTPRWEYLYFFTKVRKYYFDLDAVRQPHKSASLERYASAREGDLFGHGPQPQSFNVRVHDVKRGNRGTSAQGGELKASDKEIEEYQYPEKHHGSSMNNQERLHIDRARHGFGPKAHGGKKDNITRPEEGPEPHAFHPKGKNPGDLWAITTKPSSISVCPECDTVFPRLIKVCPNCKVEGVVGHFAPYPETLCVDPIKASSREGDVVLDMFAGGGSTGVAAKRLGRQAILIDCVRPYCIMAKYKLSKVEYQPELT